VKIFAALMIFVNVTEKCFGFEVSMINYSYCKKIVNFYQKTARNNT